MIFYNIFRLIQFQIMKKVFIGGNWKCNNTLSQTQQAINNIVDHLQFNENKVEVVVAPIFLHLVTVLFTKKQQHVQVAAQNCGANSFGAFTGQVAAQQIKDLNIPWVIVGHSERRNVLKQHEDHIAEKVKHALEVDLKVIYCFGEKLEQRQSGKTTQVVQAQLNSILNKVNNWNNVVLAYEPVWAIGTGKTATKEQVTEVHDWIRGYLQKNIGDAAQHVRIIYGGSVNQKNCGELIQVPNVDGFLVGGASLKPQFLQIVKSAQLKFK